MTALSTYASTLSALERLGAIDAGMSFEEVEAVIEGLENETEEGENGDDYDGE